MLLVIAWRDKVIIKSLSYSLRLFFSSQWKKNGNDTLFQRIKILNKKEGGISD